MRACHLVFCGLAAVVAPPLGAQAICSAPHSAPTLAGGGGLQTLDPGAGWVQLSILRQVSGRFFDPAGDRRPFLADGQVRTRSAYLTAAVGVIDGIDVWLQVPLHDVRYQDQSGARSRAGIGDPRAAVRFGSAAIGASHVPLSIRAGLKLPGSGFPVDATIIPLGEGQADVELSLESGVGFGGGAVQYLTGWVGYRRRFENAARDRKPGDELFAHLAVGGRVYGLHLELAAEALRGGTPEQLGFAVPGSSRDLFQLSPTIGSRVGPGTLEATALVPIAGANLPTGPAGSVGYRIAWGGW
ncbi:MAG TPA: hypothetical protein VGA37_02005 [Gemmatimonadales bacterium]